MAGHTAERASLSFTRPGHSGGRERWRDKERGRERERETPGLLWFVMGTIKLQGSGAFWPGHKVPEGGGGERRGEEKVERKKREDSKK